MLSKQGWERFRKGNTLDPYLTLLQRLSQKYFKLNFEMRGSHGAGNHVSLGQRKILGK